MKLLKWYNTISVFSLIFLNAIYYSEIGGTESYYRKILLINGFLFLIINLKFLRKLFFIFAIPVFLVILSLLFNFRTLGGAAINSTFYTILGFLMLAMKPIIINEMLMRKLIIWGLVVSLGFSIFAVSNAGYIIEFFVGFSNFNINPNQAGIFFYTCITVTILFVHTKWRMSLIIPFYLMVLASGSRAAFICSTLLLLFSELLVEKKENIEIFRKNIFVIFKNLLSLGTVFLGFIYYLLDYFGYLFERLMKVGISTQSVKNEGRDIIWKSVFVMINDSPAVWIFGFGPASIDSMLGERSTHNSYVDAIATKGLPFLVFALIGTIILMFYHYRKRHLIVVFSIVNILIYGYTTSDLFGGIGTLWGLIIFLSLWTRSLTKNELTLSPGNHKS